MTTIHVDIVKQEKMSGSSKGHPISLSVAADVQDFVGALLQHLYGLIDEHRLSSEYHGWVQGRMGVMGGQEAGKKGGQERMHNMGGQEGGQDRMRIMGGQERMPC